MQLRSARVAASRIQVLPSDWVNQSPDKQARQKTILANVYFSRDVCSRFTVECGFKTITVFALRRLLCELKSHEHNNGTTLDSLSDLRQSSGLGKFSELTAALARKIRPQRKIDSVWIPTYSNTHRREMKGKTRGSKNRKRQPSWGNLISFAKRITEEKRQKSLARWSFSFKVPNFLNFELILRHLIEHCNICHEKYNHRERKESALNCGHCFCFECLTTLANKLCPICRNNYTAEQIVKLF